jgi:hypothetical protein
MKTAMQDPPPRSKLESVASVAGAVVLAVFAALFFTYANIIWNPGYYGDYGLAVDTFRNSVAEVVPGSPADRAGIKPGDEVEPTQALRDRLILAGAAPHPGERITLYIHNGAERRTITLQARPAAPLPTVSRVVLGLKFLWLFVFLAVGFVLVLLRPSMMTWGLYLFGLNLTILFWPSDLFFSYIPSGWLIALTVAESIIAPAGLAGFLIFCVRFPSNAPTGWGAIIERLALCVFVVVAFNLTYSGLAAIRLVPYIAILDLVAGLALVAIFIAGVVTLLNAYLVERGLERSGIGWIALGILGLYAAFVVHRLLVEQTDDWAVFSVLILGAIVVLRTYFGARGLERYRIRWVLLGLICAFVAHAFDLVGPENGSLVYQPAGVVGAAELLYTVLPITVAYAVFRHRVIDVRFFVGRSLVVGVIVSIVALVVVATDWLFSIKLPNTHLEAAVYVGIALLVGFLLNATRQSITKAIDFTFFRPWYRTQEQVEALGDAMRYAGSKNDLYEPLTSGLANVLSLASAALFERMEGGSYVRVAACGWPAGTIWHILTDNPLTVLGRSPRVVDIDTIAWDDHDLPVGVARPTVMVPIVTRRSMPAMLLCGAHDNGTGLDPDEIRSIRRLCADAGLLYSRSTTLESMHTGFGEKQIEPLGV